MRGRLQVPVWGNLLYTLPKNGEQGRHSVGFCRIHACNIGFHRPAPWLNAVLSINSEVPCGILTAGIRFAL